MKITRRSQSHKYVSFEQVEIRDVFVDQQNNVCMKINLDYTNAVLLATGFTVKYGPKEKVRVVNTELIVEG